MTVELPGVEEQDSRRPPRPRVRSGHQAPDSRRLPPGPPVGPPPDVWVYQGRAYDLSEWIAKQCNSSGSCSRSHGPGY